VCSDDTWSALQRDKEFAFLLTMARVSNALKFGIASAYGAGEELSPAGARQGMGRFLYLTGIVHELVAFRDEHRDEWSGLTAFQQIFSVLEDIALDREVTELLNKVRNRAAFHIDPSLPGRVLPQFPNDSYSFVTGRGTRRMDSNFELADIVTFAFIFGNIDNLDAMYQRFERFRVSLNKLVSDFSRKADSVLLQRLVARGFRIEAVPDGETESS
jgi:hypothetical protein